MTEPAKSVVSEENRAKATSMTPVAWVVNGSLDLAEWVTAGRTLGALGRCSQWWLGDWIRYGNAKFGERYARAATITGYDPQTLMNMVYVASKFEISRRRENLSWSHHETVASLEWKEQEYWLERATDQRMSVADLRVELRAARKRERQQEGEAEPEYGEVEVAGEAVLCPRCGQELPLEALVR